jgi:hypothetical protein
MTLIDMHKRSCQAGVVECLRKVHKVKKLKSDYPVMAVSKFLHFFNPGLFVIWDRAIIHGKVYHAFRDDWDSSYQDILVETDDKWMRFYLAYLLWAGKVLRQGASDLMAGFATWFVGAVRDDRNADDFRQQLMRYYATAFEFIAIGSTLLELKEVNVLPRGCRQGKASRRGPSPL